MMLVNRKETGSTALENLDLYSRLLPIAVFSPFLFMAVMANIEGSPSVHAFVQFLSAGIALAIAVIAWQIKLYSGKNARIIICLGFAGASVLEACHAILLISTYRPTNLPEIVSWGWLPSRIFLPVMLCLSMSIGWHEKRHGETSRWLVPVTCALSGCIVAASCLFFWLLPIPLPQIYFPNNFIPRPIELVPALLFTLALVLVLSRGKWRWDSFEYGLLLSMLVSIAAHAIFMLHAQRNFDSFFASGSLFKLVSYLIIMLGLIRYARTAAKNEIEKERLLHQTVVTMASSGIITTDSKGVIKSFNSAAENLFGYRSHEIVGCNLEILLPESKDDGAAGVSQYIHGFRGNAISERDYFLLGRRKNGTTFSTEVAVSATALSDTQMFTVIVRDITERISKETELKVLSERLALALDSAELGCWELDLEKDVLIWNDQMYKMHGQKRLGEFLPTNAALLMVHPEDRENFRTQASNAAEEEGMFSIENRIVRPDGSTAWIKTSGKLFPGNSRQPPRFAGISRDISTTKRYIQELQAARTEADQANQAKSTFLATMSHEIRTPLNGVIGMLDVLRETSLKGYQVEMVELIQESADSLLTIVNGILDFSKIEAGEYLLSFAPCDVGTLVENVCVSLDRVAEKQHVQMTTFFSPTIPSVLVADEQLVRQVLTNLISNAIKFSSRPQQGGRVAVRCECIYQNDGEVTLEFCIRDNGIGMDVETVERLFRPFTQADQSTNRRFGGTGLGLAISKSITELLGGDIKVESAPGRGSTFIFRAPFQRVAGAVANAQTCNYIDGLSCLVIGDASGLAPDIATYLEHGRAHVERVDNLALAREWAHSQKPGTWVWIMDAGDTHPSLDELESAINCGRDSEPRLRLVVIERGTRHNLRQKADTVYTVDGNALRRKTLLRAAALAAGRSISDDDTYADLEVMHGNQINLVSRETARQSGRLILVAEDNVTNQKVIRQQLALHGVVADVTNNGYEALAHWRTGDYPLLLTDLYMPLMDGYELAAAIRSEEKENSYIGIVALTANSAAGELQRCIDAGMDSYLCKPSRLDEIEAVLNRWLPARGSNSDSIQPDSSAAKGGNMAAPQAVPPEQAVNVNILRELVGSDDDVIRELLAAFQHNALTSKTEMDVAWRSGSLNALAAAAHKLKSSARTIGALELGERCEQIETAANHGELEKVEDFMSHFDQAIDSVIGYLEAH